MDDKERLPGGMTDDTPAAIRKRVLFISVVLGAMVGVTLYLIVKSIDRDRPEMIAVILPMLLIAIPLIRTLSNLRGRSR